jgi:uncharacterized membrane protein
MDEPKDKPTNDIARELRKIRQLLYVILATLFMILGGLFGLEFGVIIALSFMVSVIISIVISILRFKTYLEKRREWEEFSESKFRYSCKNSRKLSQYGSPANERSL